MLATFIKEALLERAGYTLPTLHFYSLTLFFCIRSFMYKKDTRAKRTFPLCLSILQGLKYGYTIAHTQMLHIHIAFMNTYTQSENCSLSILALMSSQERPCVVMKIPYFDQCSF